MTSESDYEIVTSVLGDKRKILNLLDVAIKKQDVSVIIKLLKIYDDEYFSHSGKREIADAEILSNNLDILLTEFVSVSFLLKLYSTISLCTNSFVNSKFLDYCLKFDRVDFIQHFYQNDSSLFFFRSLTNFIKEKEETELGFSRLIGFYNAKNILSFFKETKENKLSIKIDDTFLTIGFIESKLFSEDEIINYIRVNKLVIYAEVFTVPFSSFLFFKAMINLVYGHNSCEELTEKQLKRIAFNQDKNLEIVDWLLNHLSIPDFLSQYSALWMRFSHPEVLKLVITYSFSKQDFEAILRMFSQNLKNDQGDQSYQGDQGNNEIFWQIANAKEENKEKLEKIFSLQLDENNENEILKKEQDLLKLFKNTMLRYQQLEGLLSSLLIPPIARLILSY
jgi:hypothetical protein